ncbi:SDR family NAD(P)-dependent oxidoreductase [Consotaella aegiceratis]|uniref:SDR family NAD(P)-dependent oxidoreductase n=1 Tax=Consotaella aegiceratis TaxID=3097961 RepID=UPI002F3F7960
MGKYQTVKSKGPLPVREPTVFPVHAGKRFIVTGGASGLGRSIVALLLAQGATVLFVDLDQARVDEAVSDFGGAEAGAFGVALDVAAEASPQAALDATLAAMGGIDGLVNCAAIVLHADPLQISRRDWQRQFEVNLFAAYDMVRVAASWMIEAGVAGAIVNIASEAGKVGHVESMAYSASKAGVINLTRMLSQALGPYDINVNCVCPGGMATPMLQEVARAYSAVTSEPADEIFAFMKDAVLGRHTEPREVARTVPSC